MFSAVVPSGAASSTFAPCSSRRLRRVDLVVEHREQQRRVAGLGFRLDVRAKLDQHSASAAALPWPAAHISAVWPLYGSVALTFAPCVSSTLIASTLPLSDGRHERGLAFFGGAVGVGAGLQQAFDDRGVAVLAGQRQRRDVVARGRVDVRARAEQQIRDLEVVRCTAQCERRGAIGGGGIHVGLLGQQGLDGGDVAVS